MSTVLAPEAGKAASFREKALRSLDKLPPLSPSVGRLLSQLAFRNVNYEDLAGFVEKDALLCAHLLRTVNSAGFARARTITSVKQAMTLLGINALRRIAVGFTVISVFSRVKAAAGWSRIRFNLHSGATAILTECIMDSLPVEEKSGAFVAGMLHDLGLLMLAVGLPDQYETIVATSNVSGQSLIDCERETLGTDHAELSGVALAKWALPDVVCKAAYYHHAPQSPEAPLLATVLNRADAFVDHLGISVVPSPNVQVAAPSLEIPGFEYDRLGVLQHFETEWKTLSEFFR